MREALKRGWSDRIVKVNKQELLATLRSNRQTHAADYQEALEGYKEQATQQLKRHLQAGKEKLERNYDRILSEIAAFDPKNPDLALDGTIILLSSIAFDLKVPENHTYDYDVAIQMASWSVEDELEITQSQLECFIMDDWEWSTGFKDTLAFYRSDKWTADEHGKPVRRED